jgi:hypothetical protein
MIPVVLIASLYSEAAINLHGNDFGTFYRAACIGPLYQDDPLSIRFEGTTFRNLTPPHFHLLIWPLCGLSTTRAYYVWMLMSIAGLFAMMRLAERARGNLWPWWGIPVAGLSVVTTTVILTGQVTGILGVPLVLAWWADRRGAPTRAGIWFGLVAIVKPFVGTIALWWLWRREWRALAAATASAACCVVLSIVVYGWPNLLAWRRELAAVDWMWSPINASIWGLWSRLTSPHPTRATLIDDPTIGLVGGVLTAIVIGTLSAKALRASTIDRGWAICLVTAILLSPLGWSYYGWWVLPFATLVPLPRWAWTLAILSWLPPLYHFPMNAAWQTLTLGSLLTVGLLAIWWALVTTREPEARLVVADNPLGPVDFSHSHGL